MLYQRSPPMNHLRVLGCLCYVHNQRHNGDKFAARGTRSIFIGYPFGKKGWNVYNLETGIISTSRDVIFCETDFPFSTLPSTSPSPSHPSAPLCFEVRDEDDFLCDLPVSPAVSTDPIMATPLPTASSSLLETAALDTSSSLVSSPLESEASLVGDISPASSSSTPLMVDDSSPIFEEAPLGRGCRTKIPSTRLHDYVTNTTHLDSDGDFVDSTWYPLEAYVSNSNFSASHQAFLAAITAGVIPRTYAEAFEDERWRGAVRGEIDALEENGTWTVETLPPGKTALGCKWVFTIKYQSDGTIERYKARLVVLGNHQTEGLDYDETFAPVCKMVSVRSFLEVAVARDWEVHQMDVHNAFLHGDLDEEVYMRFPPGFRSTDKSQVCRLHKSLYGLRQAPHCWFAKLTKALKDYGFQQNITDYSLFTMADGSSRLHVLVYVDDLIVSGSSSTLIQGFKDYLSSCFHMKDLGISKYFLGIEVARSPSGMYLCQRKYALDIISDIGLLGAKPVTHPIEQNHKLSLSTSDPLPDPTRYRRLVGRLIYLAVTRPELSYAIHVLSQFMHAPKADHWDAAVRVVRYLKNSPGQGILLRSDSDLRLTAWCDSDWAACPMNSRSLTAWFIQLGGSPISWKTRRQDRVSRSSAEAEYRAMGDTVSELLWIRELLEALGVDCSYAIPLYCDSLSALHLSFNPVFHERTKHIAKECHFIRDEIVRGVIAPQHVSTTTQLADILTKALGRKEFEAFLLKLGICDLHTPT